MISFHTYSSYWVRLFLSLFYRWGNGELEGFKDLPCGRWRETWIHEEHFYDGDFLCEHDPKAFWCRLMSRLCQRWFRTSSPITLLSGDAPGEGLLLGLGLSVGMARGGDLRWAKDPLWYNSPVGLLTTHSPMPGFSKHDAVQFTDYRSHPRHPESSPSRVEPANLCN